MTDKERLEDIKNNYSVGIHILSGKPSVAIPKENFEWLIEQAEKVEKLQQKKELAVEGFKQQVELAVECVKENNELRKQIQQAQAKAERYKQALEEIARGRFSGASYKARQALEGDND